MNTRSIPALVLAGAAALTSPAIAAPAAAQTEAAAPAIAAPITGDYGPWLPPDISVNGHRIDTLIHTLHWFSIIVLAAATAFMVYCLVKFRERPGHRASHDIRWKPVHIYFVIGIAAFELFLDVRLSNPVLATVKDNRPDDSTAAHVHVVAEQFAWNFHYPGPDGLFGAISPVFLDAASNPIGIDPGDAAGADDIVSGELHLVVNRPVICDLTSKDVIHSFSVPVLRVKQDVIPGMRIPVWFEARKTGNYEVACAQLCGNNHYSMRALMVVHSTEEEMSVWLESQRPEEFDEDSLD